MGIRLTNPERNWDLSLLARNLTNEYTYSSSGTVTFTGSGSGVPSARLGDTSAPVNRGREVMLGLAYRF